MRWDNGWVKLFRSVFSVGQHGVQGGFVKDVAIKDDGGDFAGVLMSSNGLASSRIMVPCSIG
jgi:hypothetical protein